MKNATRPTHKTATGRATAATREQTAAAALQALGLEASRWSVPLLQALHILTREGKINQDSRRKLKQVQHLYQFIEPILQDIIKNPKNHEKDNTQNHNNPLIADHGAGKSYLGFVIYDLFLRHINQGQLWAVEAREELVQSSRQLAAQLGFERMEFAHMRVADASASEHLPARFDLVCALHACDTATDDAIDFALRRHARAIVLVPCCQAELAAQLRHSKALNLARTPLAELWRHPLHTREMGSHLTNVLRCLYLQAMGYNVTVTELVGWEHSMKNELILARRSRDADSTRRSAAARLHAICEQFGLQDWAQSRFALLPTA